MRIFTSLITVTCLLIAVLALPALGDDKPTPTSCAGLAFEDPAGDQAIVDPNIRKSPDNMDIRAGFFRYVNDSSGKPVLTTNTVVSKLDKTVDDGMAGASWYFLWTNDTQVQFTRVDVIDGAITYQYGHQATDGLTVDGTTKGRFIEGDMGVVEVVVPSAMSVNGKDLTIPEAEGRIRFGGGGVTNSRPVDNGPDSGGGTDFKAVPCGGSAGAPVPPVTGPPAPGAPGSTTLNLKVLTKSAAAKKSAKGFKVSLQAGEAITNLKARLLKGKSAVATGSLAKLAAGKGSLKLKAGKKKLKKGSYKLQLTGTGAGGATASRSAAIKLR